MASDSQSIILPWSGNKDLDILPPCRLCRNESIAVGAGLCKPCMDSKIREILTNAILK